VHTAGYRIVRLANGVHSVHSLAHGETFHPVIGPAAEAEALCVRQIGLRDQVRASHAEFVIWDVGLGGAANALTVLRATRDLPCPIRLVSFDETLEPLRFTSSTPPLWAICKVMNRCSGGWPPDTSPCNRSRMGPGRCGGSSTAAISPACCAPAIGRGARAPDRGRRRG